MSSHPVNSNLEPSESIMSISLPTFFVGIEDPINWVVLNAIEGIAM